ncbi:hypothetical protein LINPERHAP1_LOCUS25650 [Linum perenne]
MRKSGMTIGYSGCDRSSEQQGQPSTTSPY